MDCRDAESYNKWIEMGELKSWEHGKDLFEIIKVTLPDVRTEHLNLDMFAGPTGADIIILDEAEALFIDDTDIFQESSEIIRDKVKPLENKEKKLIFITGNQPDGEFYQQKAKSKKDDDFLSIIQTAPVIKLKKFKLETI